MLSCIVSDMTRPALTINHQDFYFLQKMCIRDRYKGFKIVPYCPRCGTPLSSHEVAQGYKDVKERSAIAKFKLKDEDAYFLAWTTTPWTLPSNVALCVNPDEAYVKAVSYTHLVWLSLVERYVRDVEAAGSNPVTSTTAHIIAASPTASVLLEL